MDPRADALYRALQGRIDFSNLVPTCLEIAQEIEQIQGMKGSEKLSLLQSVLRAAVRDSKISMTEKEERLHTIDTVVPFVAQAVVFASKNPLAKRIQAGCLACFSRKTRQTPSASSIQT